MFYRRKHVDCVSEFRGSGSSLLSCARFRVRLPPVFCKCNFFFAWFRSQGDKRDLLSKLPASNLPISTTPIRPELEKRRGRVKKERKAGRVEFPGLDTLLNGTHWNGNVNG